MHDLLSSVSEVSPVLSQGERYSWQYRHDSDVDEEHGCDCLFDLSDWRGEKKKEKRDC
jgi:hypothetical protein